jgi:hypothetical protein
MIDMPAGAKLARRLLALPLNLCALAALAQLPFLEG